MKTWISLMQIWYKFTFQISASSFTNSHVHFFFHVPFFCSWCFPQLWMITGSLSVSTTYWSKFSFSILRFAHPKLSCHIILWNMLQIIWYCYPFFMPSFNMAFFLKLFDIHFFTQVFNFQRTCKVAQICDRNLQNYNFVIPDRKSVV